MYEVIANNVVFLDTKKDENIEQKADDYFANAPTKDISEDDLPF